MINIHKRECFVCLRNEINGQIADTPKTLNSRGKNFKENKDADRGLYCLSPLSYRPGEIYDDVLYSLSSGGRYLSILMYTPLHYLAL